MIGILEVPLLSVVVMLQTKFHSKVFKKLLCIQIKKSSLKDYCYWDFSFSAFLFIIFAFFIQALNERFLPF